MSDDTISDGPWPDPPANLSSPAPQVQAQKPGRPFQKIVKPAGTPVNQANLARVAIRPTHP